MKFCELYTFLLINTVKYMKVFRIPNEQFPTCGTYFFGNLVWNWMKNKLSSSMNMLSVSAAHYNFYYKVTFEIRNCVVLPQKCVLRLG